MLENINKYNVILASNSPRRHELLKMLDIPFKTATPLDIQETYPDRLSAYDIPEYLAKVKAKAYSGLMHGRELIITADTVVILDNQVLGKPVDNADAVRMLMLLSGRRHTVVTGVAITTIDRSESFSVRSDVKFATLNLEEARYYVSHYSPLDKAGAYGIQEWIGAVAVESIEGSFYNVMGLPVHQLYRHLAEF